MVVFSLSLINEYQREMLISYGVSVSKDDAQIQLLSLTHSLFPIAITVSKAESREVVQGKTTDLSSACATSLSAIIARGNGLG